METTPIGLWAVLLSSPQCPQTPHSVAQLSRRCLPDLPVYYRIRPRVESENDMCPAPDPVDSLPHVVLE